jgi:3-hydroxyacyl-[acyl-carrier-protein] dehydratase
MTTPYTITDILQLLPHRYPFVLIDRIEEMVLGERITALKNVTFNEPFFQGHFPGRPIMPGVLIVEAMGQAGGVLAFNTLGRDATDVLLYFTGLDRVRFRKPVVPGDQLRLDVEILKFRKTAVKMAAVASVDGQRVAEAHLMAVFGDME